MTLGCKPGLGAASGGTHGAAPLLAGQRGAGSGKATHDIHIRCLPREVWGEVGAVLLGREDAPIAALQRARVVGAPWYDILGTDQGGGQTLKPVGGQEGVSEGTCVPGDLHPSPLLPGETCWNRAASCPWFSRVEDASAARDSTPSPAFHSSGWAVR